MRTAEQIALIDVIIALREEINVLRKDVSDIKQVLDIMTTYPEVA